MIEVLEIGDVGVAEVLGAPSLASEAPAEVPAASPVVAGPGDRSGLEAGRRVGAAARRPVHAR